jgi:hypothetical protein
MLRDDVEGPLERRHVERAAELNHSSDVGDRRLGVKVMQQKESALDGREWKTPLRGSLW